MTGEDFKRAREARGLTMREASMACGLDGAVDLLSGIECGAITGTSSKCMALVCDVYGVDRASAVSYIACWSPGMGAEKYLETEQAGKRRAGIRIKKILEARREREKKEARERAKREALEGDKARAAYEAAAQIDLRGEPMNLQAVDMDYLRDVIEQQYKGGAQRFADISGVPYSSIKRIMRHEATRMSFKNATLIASMADIDAKRFWPNRRSEGGGAV